MKGSIRFIFGFLLTLGAVGGLDFATDAQSEVLQVLFAVIGLLIMWWGVRAINEYN